MICVGYDDMLVVLSGTNFVGLAISPFISLFVRATKTNMKEIGLNYLTNMSSTFFWFSTGIIENKSTLHVICLPTL